MNGHNPDSPAAAPGRAVRPYRGRHSTLIDAQRDPA
jgi:hypothetical protein